MPAKSLAEMERVRERAPGSGNWRAARSETSVRERSIVITTATAANTHQRASTSRSRPSRRAARRRAHPTATLTSEQHRTPPRARPGAPPCRDRTGASGRPAVTAIPIAKNVSSAATRSVPECSASETRPRLTAREPGTELDPHQRHGRTDRDERGAALGLIGAKATRAITLSSAGDDRRRDAARPGSRADQQAPGDLDGVDALGEQHDREHRGHERLQVRGERRAGGPMRSSERNQSTFVTTSGPSVAKRSSSPDLPPSPQS